MPAAFFAKVILLDQRAPCGGSSISAGQMEAIVDKFLHERTLEMYRAQLNRTTKDDTRRQILRLISEETIRYLPKAGLTAPNFSFSRRDGSGGAAARRMSGKT